MSYIDKLELSSNKAKNCVCMGLDPQIQRIPSNRTVIEFFDEVTSMMQEKNLIPAAFKPNIGYWTALNNPKSDNYIGTNSLIAVIKMLNDKFPGIPIILDSKRGDIARSSLNYAIEAFDNFGADSITVSPYMGSDSVLPFAYKDKGVYILNRTSNKGGVDLQNLKLEDGSYLYEAVARQIIKYNESIDNSSRLGAVVGATNLKELDDICKIYKGHKVPLLIPGVGAQGASATDTLNVLKANNMDLSLVRINSSSGLTSPFNNNVPKNYLEEIENAIRNLMEECAI